MQHYWHKTPMQMELFLFFFFLHSKLPEEDGSSLSDDSDNEKPEIRLIELILLQHSVPSNTKDAVGCTVAGLFMADLHSLQMDVSAFPPVSYSV